MLHGIALPLVTLGTLKAIQGESFGVTTSFTPVLGSRKFLDQFKLSGGHETFQTNDPPTLEKYKLHFPKIGFLGKTNIFSYLFMRGPDVSADDGLPIQQPFSCFTSLSIMLNKQSAS